LASSAGPSFALWRFGDPGAEASGPFQVTVEVASSPRGPKTKLKGEGAGHTKRTAEQEAARQVLGSRQLRKQVALHAAAAVAPRKEGPWNPKGHLQEVVSRGLLEMLGFGKEDAFIECESVYRGGLSHAPMFEERVRVVAPPLAVSSGEEDAEDEEEDESNSDAGASSSICSFPRPATGTSVEASGRGPSKRAAQAAAAEALLLELQGQLERLSRSTKL
jgi:dsRNA-specific ribonuclease